MKKILFLVPRMNIGGAETYVFTTVKELQKRGRYEIFLASGGGHLSDTLKKEGVKTFFLPVRQCPLLSVWLLCRIIKKYKIDLIHANSGAAGIVAAQVKRKLDIPVIYTAHGIFGNPEKEKIIDELDTIICVSRFVKDDSIKRGFSPRHLTVRYSGIDTDIFRSDPDMRTALRKSYGFGKDTLVLALVSRIKNLENKGHRPLLHMLHTYGSEENWKVMIIGKGRGLSRLQSEIRSMNLSNKVVCLGHRTDVARLLNAADIVLLPSQFETFGLVLAEGMAMGKPAVAFSVGGTPEIIEDGKTGFLVEKNNEKELYEKIKLLDTDRTLLSRFSKESIRRVRHHFTKEKMVDDLEAVYEEYIK